jgi:hypothetical protein
VEKNQEYENSRNQQPGEIRPEEPPLAKKSISKSGLSVIPFKPPGKRQSKSHKIDRYDHAEEKRNHFDGPSVRD